ncbi:NAD(P)H-dependent oxidoreductase [Aestuariibius sp. HNIBRBA575]|uniref:NAD(P)H-dependent oxidoreductase n=1 Tax=Aestuariibius sp. HNIBRBA575 TaxID=3233343 RepID=UPI0034A33551
MARVIRYYAHPGHRHSKVNALIDRAANQVTGVTHVDLYAQYPRFNIAIDTEQDRLRDHDVIVLQFPVFWYSCPALVKEWIDLVFEHGFAYGAGGDALKGKTLMLALTTGGGQDAYSPQGYQHYDLRTFLTPFERTAGLSQMQFCAPYTFFGAINADAPQIEAHIDGFCQLLGALRDDQFDLTRAAQTDIITADTLPLLSEA